MEMTSPQGGRIIYKDSIRTEYDREGRLISRWYHPDPCCYPYYYVDLTNHIWCSWIPMMLYEELTMEYDKFTGGVVQSTGNPTTVFGPIIVEEHDKRHIRHDSFAAVLKEATRLAKENPGKKFAVYMPMDLFTSPNIPITRTPISVRSV